jgi:hypothetical protein
MPQEKKKHGGGGPPTWLRVLSPISNLAAMGRGGKVRKTGKRKVHKGEEVVPRHKAKKVERTMKRAKMKMRGGKR